MRVKIYQQVNKVPFPNSFFCCCFLFLIVKKYGANRIVDVAKIGTGAPPWGTIPDDQTSRNIAERLWNWQEEYFRFIESNIPPTNNLAEQAVRKVVIDRKVTQGTRSDWGNRWLERFWSVLATCEQQGTNVMSFLKSCIESFLHGLAPPSLLRD